MVNKKRFANRFFQMMKKESTHPAMKRIMLRIMVKLLNSVFHNLTLRAPLDEMWKLSLLPIRLAAPMI